MKKNKVLYLGIMFIIFISSTLIINSQENINESRWVTADVGLNMRDSPNLNAKKIGLIPYGEQVLLIEETGKLIAISGVTGKWSKIKWKGKMGWVFGAYLTGNKITGETSDNSGQSIDIDSWKTFTNKKYGYSFKYPPGYTTGKCPKPCKRGLVSTNQSTGATFIQGNISEKGWPMIIITKIFKDPIEGKGLYEWLQEKADEITEENLPEGTTEITIGSGKLEVVKVYIPQSPQTYSFWDIYYLKDGKMFLIQMFDVDTPAALEFYNTWLTGFKL